MNQIVLLVTLFYCITVQIAEAKQNMKAIPFEDKELSIAPIMRMDLKFPYVITTDDNAYYGWDIQKGKQVWRNVTIGTTCHDCEANPNVALFHTQNRAFITPAFGGVSGFQVDGRRYGIMDFNLKDGTFIYPKISDFGAVTLSDDDSLIGIQKGNRKIALYLMDKLQKLTIDKQFNEYKKRGLDRMIGEPEHGYSDEIIDFDDGVISSMSPNIKRKILEDSDSVRKMLSQQREYSQYIQRPVKPVAVIKLELINNITYNDRRQYILSDNVLLLRASDGIFELYHTKNLEKIATFIGFNQSEWLVFTPQGYFNASSQKMVTYLRSKNPTFNYPKEDNELIQHYFHPDIVESLLSKKPAVKSSTFELPEKGHNNNQYRASLYKQVVMASDYGALYVLGMQKNIEDIPFVHTSIDNAKKEQDFSLAYRALSNYDANLSQEFLAKRIEFIDNNSNEQAALVDYMFRIKHPQISEVIANLKKRNLLTVETKKTIASYINKPEYYQEQESVLWELWEENFTINTKTLLFLSKADLKRAQKDAEKTIIYLYKNRLDYAPKENSRDVERRFFDDKALLMKMYEFIIETNSTHNMSEVKHVSKERLSRYYTTKDKVFSYDEERLLISFLMKYGNDLEKKSCIEIAIKYIEATYAYDDYEEIDKRNKILLALLPHDRQYVIEKIKKMAYSKEKLISQRAIVIMYKINDPSFVQVLLDHLYDEKKRFRYDTFGSLTREYDSKEVRMRLIQKVNQDGNCSDSFAQGSYQFFIKSLTDDEKMAFKCVPK